MNSPPLSKPSEPSEPSELSESSEPAVTLAGLKQDLQEGLILYVVGASLREVVVLLVGLILSPVVIVPLILAAQAVPELGIRFDEPGAPEMFGVLVALMVLVTVVQHGFSYWSSRLARWYSAPLRQWNEQRRITIEAMSVEEGGLREFTVSSGRENSIAQFMAYLFAGTTLALAFLATLSVFFLVGAPPEGVPVNIFLLIPFLLGLQWILTGLMRRYHVTLAAAWALKKLNEWGYGGAEHLRRNAETWVTLPHVLTALDTLEELGLVQRSGVRGKELPPEERTYRPVT